MIKNKKDKNNDNYIGKHLQIIKSNDPKYKLIPWIEKYRPKVLDDIILDDNMKAIIKDIINKKDSPNLIITGTPGTGKTTTFGCIGIALYGKYYKDAVLELNASDDRGKKSVQDDIDKFCKQSLEYADEDIGKYSKHKLVILDEADNITEKAQHLISTIVEKHHKTTRFAFTCNTSSDIIESIQSRCKILRYITINSDKMINRLKDICIEENVKYENDGLDAIVNMAQGDMRFSINLLQLVFNKNEKITLESVISCCDRPQPLLLKEILLDCINNKFKNALTKILNLKSNGYSGIDIILSIVNSLKLQLLSDISEKNKIIIMNTISPYAHCICKGIDSDIQITGFIAELASIYQKY